MGGTSEMEASRVELRRGLIFAGDVDRRQFRQRIGEPWLARIERARRFQRQLFQRLGGSCLRGESSPESIQVGEHDAADIEDFSRHNLVAKPRRKTRGLVDEANRPCRIREAMKTGEAVEKP